MIKNKADDLASSLYEICHGDAKNVVAWRNLYKVGITPELLKQVSGLPYWIGPKPDFSKAPSSDDPMWKGI